MVTKKLKSGVVLGFDDHFFIEDWLEVTDLFDNFDAYVTFFIHAPDQMNEKQWKGLTKLVSEGHAVGCHSLRHEKAVDYCENHGDEQWVNKEILSSLELLINRGFDVSSFAYPCSQNDDTTDKAIMSYFKHARTGAFLPEGKRFVDLDIIFKSVENVADHFLLPAKGVDQLEDVSLIDEAAERAVNRNELLFLYGHRIGEKARGKENRNLTNKYILQRMLEIIKSYDLMFYTYNDLL